MVISVQLLPVVHYDVVAQTSGAWRFSYDIKLGWDGNTQWSHSIVPKENKNSFLSLFVATEDLPDSLFMTKGRKSRKWGAFIENEIQDVIVSCGAYFQIKP